MIEVQSRYWVSWSSVVATVGEAVQSVCVGGRGGGGRENEI